MDERIKEGTLSEFLQKHRREVRDMCLTEFNEKKFEQVVRDDAVGRKLRELYDGNVIYDEETFRKEMQRLCAT